ncbi:hypothetical protein ABT354_01930 [Streptomyces sp. NPDC000594]|uniref:hypothetical protein n=1 Tax=Streptomyces sp. NPDC000594 TaxID=3154261 RepID=UPI003330F521
MTYEITLVRVGTDSATVAEALDLLNAGFDPDADPDPLRLTDGERAGWDRLLDRVTREIGPVEPQEYPYSLSFWSDGPHGSVLFQYYGNTAAIEIPYRWSGPAALPVMELAYRIARLAEDECGLTGHDFEVDQPTRTGDPVRAATLFGGVTDWAHRHIAGRPA